MSKKKPLLTVKNLSKRYKDFIEVDSVSFDVYENEIFGILGPNGAGKTTTVEMIEGIRIIDEGDIEIDGIDVDKDPEGYRHRKYILRH